MHRGMPLARASRAICLAALSFAFSIEPVFVGQLTETQFRPKLRPRQREKRQVLLRYKVGDAVEANHGNGNWFPARVEKINKDGSFLVQWDEPDGGPETSKVRTADVRDYVPPIPLDQLKPGEKYAGNVVTINPFGVFVNFGAERDGLVHVSAIQEGFLSNPAEVLQVGQDVTVWIKGVTDGKISLVMVQSKLSGGGGRSSAPRDVSPFKSLAGKTLPGKVMSVMSFGAFVQIQHPYGGAVAQGLVHVSEMSDNYVNEPSEVVSVGQEVQVRITEVNIGTGKIDLSMKTV